MKLDKKTVGTIIFLIIVAVCLFAIATNMSGFLGFIGTLISAVMPVIVGLSIAFVMNVLMRALENKVFAFMGKSKHKWIRACVRPICLVLTLLLIFGLVALALIVAVPQIIKTVQEILGNMQFYAESVLKWATGVMQKLNVNAETIENMKLDWSEISAKLVKYVQSYSGKIANKATGITADVVTGIYDILFEIIIAVYVLAQKEKISLFFKRLVLAIFKHETCDKIFDVTRLSYNAFSSFIRGQFIEGVILGSVCFICMKIFGFPYAAIISMMIGIGALIPIIGAWASTAIGALLIFTVSPTYAVFFVLFIIILQLVDGNLIYPRVVGETMGMPSLIVICMVLIGGNLYGVAGILVAVPIGSVLYVLVKRAVAKKLKTKKITDNGDAESIAREEQGDSVSTSDTEAKDDEQSDNKAE